MGDGSERDRIGWIEPLANRVRGMLLRGIVHRADDSAGRQKLQIETLEDDVDDDVDHLLPYGFNAVPLPPDTADGGAAEIVAAAIGGERDHTVVLVVLDARHRPTGWDPGDVGLYDHRGQRIRLRDGRIELDGDSEIHLGSSAVLGVARETDDVTINGTTDPAFVAWMAQVDAAIGVMAPGFNASPPGTPVLSLGTGSVIPSVNPAQALGKITSASGNVKAED